MSADRFLHLVTKKFSSLLTAGEEAELNLFLQDAENRQTYQTLKRFWQDKEKEAAPDVERAFSKVMAAIEEEEPVPATLVKRSLLQRYKVAFFAAMVLLLGAVGFFLSQHFSNNTSLATNNAGRQVNNGFVEKQNAKGTRSIITLADGSKVWLNADSRLQYPAAFEGATREITLSGEAFFEVTRNKQKPFIIHLRNGTVRVLGTSFNIKAYDNSPSVETSVATGRVAFIPAHTKAGEKADTVFLTKDKKVVYTVHTGTVKTVATASAVDKAWTEGKLIFNGSSMDEIATTLERYFGKQVIINDEDLHTYHLTGSFENNSAEEILYYLSKSKPFTYRITETQIILSALR